MVDEYNDALLSTISITLKLKCDCNVSTKASMLSYLFDSNLIEYFEDSCPLVNHFENSSLYYFYFIIINLKRTKNKINSILIPITLSFE